MHVSPNNLDAKDRRILFECDLDAQESDAVLARRCGLSPGVFSYRLQRLIEQRIIRGFTLIPNLSDFGKTAYGVYCRAPRASEAQIDALGRSLEIHPDVYWTARLAGEYDFLAAFAAAEPKVFLDRLHTVFKGKLGGCETSVALRVSITQFQRSYLVGNVKKRRTFTFESGGRERKLAPLDCEILRVFNDSPRISYSGCAAKLRVDRTTVKRRLHALIDCGVVRGITTLVDSAALGHQVYHLLLYLNSFGQEERERLNKLAYKTPTATELLETIGPWQAELHVEVPDQRALQQVLSDVRTSLGSAIKEIRVVLNTEYYQKYKFPVD